MQLTKLGSISECTSVVGQERKQPYTQFTHENDLRFDFLSVQNVYVALNMSKWF